MLAAIKSKAGSAATSSNRRNVVLCGNTAWGMLNFRKDLILAMLKAGHTVTVMAPPAPEAAGLQALGATFVPVPIQGKGKNPVVEVACARRIHKLLKQIAPDVVLSFTIKSVIYCGIACRLLKIPHVPTITGMGSAFINKSWVTYVAVTLYKTACANAWRVLFLNESDRKFFVNAGIVRVEQSKIIPGEGIDVAHFAPRTRPATSAARKFKFLYCGRVLAEKGFLELIEATRSLLRSGSVFEMHVVGFADWDNPSAIRKQQLDRWVAEGVIIFHGSSDDVRPWIADADCMVLPSYREGLSRILLEAASMECAMIASDVPGCREIVRNELTGLTFAPRSSQALAGCMARVMRLPAAQIKQFGINARRVVLEEYSNDVVARRYLSLLQDCTAT